MENKVTNLLDPGARQADVGRAKRLREATHEMHERLDKSIMMHKAFESLARYGLFVQVQHQFHREIDALYSNQVLDKLLPDLSGRRRFDLIERDLADLRVTVPSLDALPAFASSTEADVPTALGWLYVAEGSNLGAAFLLKEVRKLGLSETFGRPSTGPVDLPVAVVADHTSDNRLTELRVYSSNWPLTGRHVVRPPLLQADPELRLPDVVETYQRALADGDVEAAVSTFVSHGYVREPSGGEHVHTGLDELRRLHEQQFSNGGIEMEHCALNDDGRTCALEYNAVRWGETELAPQAGVAVYVRGHDGLEAVRIYDDVDPPLPGT